MLAGGHKRKAWVALTEIGGLEFCAQWQVYFFSLYVRVHVIVKLGRSDTKALCSLGCHFASALSLTEWEVSRIPKCDEFLGSDHFSPMMGCRELEKLVFSLNIH